MASIFLTLALPGIGFAEDDDRGEVLFELCQQCHGPAGAGDSLFLAPAIAGMDQWYLEVQLNAFRAGIRGVHPDDLGGLRMYPMAQWLKSEADVTAVASYVAAMPVVSQPATLEGGDALEGKNLYKVCEACHGPDGAGNMALNAPPLRGGNDWYLIESLKKFKAGVRGGNLKNAPAVMMRGMSMSLADDQAMKDVVAHIMTLSN